MPPDLLADTLTDIRQGQRDLREDIRRLHEKLDRLNTSGCAHWPEHSKLGERVVALEAGRNRMIGASTVAGVLGGGVLAAIGKGIAALLNP